jgi:hypothetical protein
VNGLCCRHAQVQHQQRHGNREDAIAQRREAFNALPRNTTYSWQQSYHWAVVDSKAEPITNLYAFEAGQYLCALRSPSRHRSK